MSFGNRNFEVGISKVFFKNYTLVYKSKISNFLIVVFYYNKHIIIISIHISVSSKSTLKCDS
nr:MAG TPA: hypothetical protein [Caudoviricetes sp.]